MCISYICIYNCVLMHIQVCMYVSIGYIFVCIIMYVTVYMYVYISVNAGNSGSMHIRM